MSHVTPYTNYGTAHYDDSFPPEITTSIVDLVDNTDTLKACTLIQRDWSLRARSRLFHTFVIPPVSVPLVKIAPFAEYICTLEGQTFLPLVRTLRLDGYATFEGIPYIPGHISLCALRRLVVLFDNLQRVEIHNMCITRCAAPAHHPCLELMKVHRIYQLELVTVTCDYDLETQTPLLTRLAPNDTLFLSSINLRILSLMDRNTIKIANCVLHYLDTGSTEFRQLVDAIAPTVSSLTFRSVDPRDVHNMSPFIAKLAPALTSLSIEICMYQFCKYRSRELFRTCSNIGFMNNHSHIRSRR